MWKIYISGGKPDDPLDLNLSHIDGEIRTYTVEDVVADLNKSKSVILVPGYDMAVKIERDIDFF